VNRIIPNRKTEGTIPVKTERDNPERAGDKLEDFEIGYFRPEDAEGIVALFREVYGEGYPIKVFYDPASLTRANELGDYYSFVARTRSGRVVSVQHLFRSAPSRFLYEAGSGLVTRDYRNLGLATATMRYEFEEWVPNNDNIHAIFGEPVCNHPYMQRTVVTLGYHETAIEVALMPAEAFDKEKSASGRVAALLAFRTYRPRPHRIFLPSAYANELRAIYSRLDDARELAVANGNLAAGVASRADMTVFDFARVARIAVLQAGADFDSVIGELEEQAVARKTVVIQVWVNLASPAVGEAVEILRRRGYFFGGLLPRWFDDDGFLMQKVLCEPNLDKICIYSDSAKEIMEIAAKDYERACGAGRVLS